MVHSGIKAGAVDVGGFKKMLQCTGIQHNEMVMALFRFLDHDGKAAINFGTFVKCTLIFQIGALPLMDDKLFDSEKHVRDLKAENAAKVKAKAAELVAKKKREDKQKKPEMSLLAGKFKKATEQVKVIAALARPNEKPSLATSFTDCLKKMAMEDPEAIQPIETRDRNQLEQQLAQQLRSFFYSSVPTKPEKKLASLKIKRMINWLNHCLGFPTKS